MPSAPRLILLALLLAAMVACGPTPAPARDTGERSQPASMPQRTLVMIGRGEPPSIAAKPIVAFSGSIGHTTRLFNAMLDFLDEKGTPQPYLAEELPRLNTDTWRLLPEGRMQTTYRLRPSLTWQDGAPLSAEDFVFAWRVFSNPEFGVSGSLPVGAMADVLAPDARTLVIQWRRLYPEAAALDLDFQALPRHLLEEPLQQLDPLAFVGIPFWTSEYVGLGPYRVERWEPGSAVEAVAFSSHALGRPKIDRIRLIFIADPNTALANMLSGEAHFLGESVIWYEEGTTLEREWAARGASGTVLYSPVVFRVTQFQHRAEAAQPRGLLDVRVRRALAHGIDTATAFELTTGGNGVLSPSLTPPLVEGYEVIERALARYPYDARATQRLLEEFGLTRGGDSFYTGPGAEQFKLEVATDAGTTNERENAIFVDSLRRVGVDATSKVIPVAQLRDTQARALLPGLHRRVAEEPVGGGDQQWHPPGREPVGGQQPRWLEQPGVRPAVGGRAHDARARRAHPPRRADGEDPE